MLGWLRSKWVTEDGFKKLGGGGSKRKRVEQIEWYNRRKTESNGNHDKEARHAQYMRPTK